MTTIVKSGLWISPSAARDQGDTRPRSRDDLATSTLSIMTNNTLVNHLVSGHAAMFIALFTTARALGFLSRLYIVFDIQYILLVKLG